MKKLLLATLALCWVMLINAQTIFDEEVTLPVGYTPAEVVMPPSPLEMQVLFIGGTDMVQTTETYGNLAGETPAKEWHDFIGFTPDETEESLGWVSINHERITADDMIGDGGGMTVFRVKRAEGGSLEVMDQTLEDGRQGQFFNVDFANTVGETGMNCGGICSTVDGRIWTAEEWFRSDNSSINGFPTDEYPIGSGVRDTSAYTVSSDIPGWDGVTLEKYENFNWMVEIDPRQAKAIRKQYNWGRQPFEGGAVNEANEIVYLGPDATPGFFGMFVAETPGDFTKGTLFAYKHDKEGYNWIPLWRDGDMLNHKDAAVREGATMFNRIEWVAFDPNTSDVYFTETGRDNPGSRWADELEEGAVFHPETIALAEAQGLDSPTSPDYTDYYGRIWKYDVRKDELSIYLNGGPFFEESPEEADYPEKHLSNPDGLNIMQIDGKSFLVIQEDLNGTSNGRVPAGVTNRTCEIFLLDLSIEEPTIDDLIRLTAVPAGAEVTGAMPTPDGKSLLINAQHPSSDNPFPFNHSLTFALHGFDQVSANSLHDNNPFGDVRLIGETGEQTEVFSAYPNPTTRLVYLNEMTDVAVYNAQGQRIMVTRNVDKIDVSQLATGIYYLQNAKGDMVKLSVQ